jgi:hypothetical protein
LDLDSGDNIWKEFVTAVVKHSLSAPELHIAYYEMWNEPDLSRNWTGTPTQLAKMVEDAYAIIHALDPNAKVIGPTPSTANQYGVHFLPDYYAAGGRLTKAEKVFTSRAFAAPDNFSGNLLNRLILCIRYVSCRDRLTAMRENNDRTFTLGKASRRDLADPDRFCASSNCKQSCASGCECG